MLSTSQESRTQSEHEPPAEPIVSIVRVDPERRLGLPAGRFTQPNHFTALVAAGALTAGFYAALLPFEPMWVYQTFTQRGWVPYSVVLLSFWSLVILFVKWRKLAAQRRALSVRLLPDDPTFVLSPNAATEVLNNLHVMVDEPRAFFLFNRIEIALSNLRNLGRVADVDEILQSQADNDESVVESSYTILRGLLWAIPVLGFIGTVLGLSSAITSFSGILQASDDARLLRDGLRDVTVGLAIAFETTLHALVAALAIHLLLTMVHRKEEELLDGCRDYCQRNIVGRLRLTMEGT
jgi:biopolymer transport protein ExbB/TolQ